ncbi:Diguanylate cyclase [Sulfidibacter corallicola]|uniref:diguanylate cyclase n=1 Tax=Sulfidibacter corallicola TaxID=2818388 RepID=A0A8A4TQM6_SULCO|nr:diguanylate cyclase [Sulfidibacter corallicola]QTD51860.1 diguanylate cyclase [Sulfidibacter corallicola]
MKKKRTALLGATIGLLFAVGWIGFAVVFQSWGQSVRLSKGEKRWLEAHKDRILVAPDPMAPPIDMFDENGTHTGLSADYLAIIQERLESRFDIVRLPTWHHVLEEARARRVSVVSVAVVTPERREYLDFTVPIVTIPNVIITNKANTEDLDLTKLEGRLVSVPEGYAVQEFLTRNYPRIEIAPVANSLEGLRSVSFGESEAMVLDLTQASYLIQEHAITNLRVAGEVDYELNLCFAVRKDWPQLVNILNKAISSIDHETRDDIFQKWISLTNIPWWQTPRFWKKVFSSLILVFTPMLLILLWNLTLRRKIKRRTSALQKELERRREAEEQLKIHKQDLRTIVAVRTEELQSLNRVASVTEKQSWLGDLIDLILEQALALFEPAEKATFFLKDLSTGHFFIAAAKGYPRDQWEGVSVTKEALVARYTAENYMLCEGIYLVHHTLGISGDETLRGFDRPQAILSMSVAHRPDLDGFLVLDNFVDSRAFDDIDAHKLSWFREHVITAVVKARLLEKINDRTMELEQKNRQLEDATRQLEELCVTDALTKLRNRRYLEQTMDVDIAQSIRAYAGGSPKANGERPKNADISFLMLDVDHFKSVNDTYGHESGDRVLVQISELMKRVCRGSDSVIRWGGEEFLIVARSVHREQMAVLAERLRGAVEHHDFNLGNGQVIRRTCSIGFASFPFLVSCPEIFSWEQVVSLADKALYIAKKSQRNAWVGVHPMGDVEPKAFLAGLVNLQEMVSQGGLALETSIAERSRLVFV